VGSGIDAERREREIIYSWQKIWLRATNILACRARAYQPRRPSGCEERCLGEIQLSTVGISEARVLT
jgi:hypothetical protein